MFKDLILAKLEEAGHDYIISGNEVRTTCLNPLHDDSNPSYSINIDTGANHCFACGYAISPKVFFGDMDDESIDDLLRRSKYNNLLAKPATSESVTFFLPPKAYDIDRNWRGLSQELLLKVGAYYCDTGRFKGRLVFPIYYNDELQGVDTRIVNYDIAEFQDSKWLRSKNMTVQSIVYPYNYLVTLPFNVRRHVVLCEGVADALSYLECGVAAIPTFGLGAPDMGRITKLLELGVDTVTLAYDNDERGREGALRVYPYYKKWFDVKPHPLVNKVKYSNYKDANEALLGGVLHSTQG